jgi:hypothetical protein
MTWDDVSYLHVQRIEINDLVFLKLFFNGEMWRVIMWLSWFFRIIFSIEKGDVAWGDFLEFLELYFNRERWRDICISCMYNYYLCDFLEIIDNKKRKVMG